MKKLMGFLFVLVFILGIIFVLLPFLETTPPPSAATAVQARPRPQIFTSNPLTTLVKRIVNALQTEWDKKREKRRLAVARMQGKRQLAPTDYRAALVHSLPQDGTPAEEIALPETEEYDGNWLISPQISPKDAAAKGMHEVSITDEPAQNTETINIPLPQEAAALSAQSESLPTDNAAQNAPMQLARANTILDISLPATQVQGQQAPTVKTKSEVALQNLLDILYPEKKIEKIIRNMADVKFGMLPSTEENKSAKATYIKETTKQAIEELRRLQTQKIHRLLTEGPQPDDLQTDYLAEYLQACAEEGIEPEEHPIRILIRDNDGNTYYTNTSTRKINLDWLQERVSVVLQEPFKKLFSTGGKGNDPENDTEETGSTGGKGNDSKKVTEGTVSTEGEPTDPKKAAEESSTSGLLSTVNDSLFEGYRIVSEGASHIDNAVRAVATVGGLASASQLFVKTNLPPEGGESEEGATSESVSSTEGELNDHQKVAGEIVRRALPVLSTAFNEGTSPAMVALRVSDVTFSSASQLLVEKNSSPEATSKSGSSTIREPQKESFRLCPTMTPIDIPRVINSMLLPPVSEK